MAKYCGLVGIATQQETSPGVWKPVIVEHEVFGDVVRDNVNFQQSSSDQLNDKIKINNQISIIVDPIVMENFSSIIYITYWGAKFKIVTAEVKYPRVLLSMGEVYNG